MKMSRLWVFVLVHVAGVNGAAAVIGMTDTEISVNLLTFRTIATHTTIIEEYAPLEALMFFEAEGTMEKDGEEISFCFTVPRGIALFDESVSCKTRNVGLEGSCATSFGLYFGSTKGSMEITESHPLGPFTVNFDPSATVGLILNCCDIIDPLPPGPFPLPVRFPVRGE